MDVVPIYGKRKRTGLVSSTAIRRIVRSELKEDQENKYSDWVGPTINPVNTTPLVDPVFRATVGSQYFDRLGLVTQLERIVVRMLFRVNTVGAVVGQTIQTVRVMLVMDSQTDGAVPNLFTFPGQAEGILQGFNAVTDDRNIVAQRSPFWQSRFVILRDQVVTLDSGRSLSRAIKWVVKTKAHVHFLTSAPGTFSPADLGRNSLFLCFYSLSSANGPRIDYQVRTVFTDS